MGQTEAGFASLNRVLAIAPTFADGFRYRAEAYRNSGEIDKALAERAQAIKLNPKNPVYYGARALIHQSRGEFDLAVADYDRMIAINPKDTQALQFKRI